MNISILRKLLEHLSAKSCCTKLLERARRRAASRSFEQFHATRFCSSSCVKILVFKMLIVVLSSYVTPGPYFERTVRTSSKSLNGRKIARMAPILTIFGPNRSRRRDLFFEKFSNERRRHRRLVVVSSSPSSSPPSSPSSPQHNYLRSQLLRAAVRFFLGYLTFARRGRFKNETAEDRPFIKVVVL